MCELQLSRHYGGEPGLVAPRAEKASLSGASPTGSGLHLMWVWCLRKGVRLGGAGASRWCWAGRTRRFPEWASPCTHPSTYCMRANASSRTLPTSLGRSLAARSASRSVILQPSIHCIVNILTPDSCTPTLTSLLTDFHVHHFFCHRRQEPQEREAPVHQPLRDQTCIYTRGYIALCGTFLSQ